MTQLTDIITINITRETAAVAQTNFNVPLFIATHTQWAERAREYASLSEVASDFPTTSKAYTAASKLFGQQIRPAKIVIGRRQVPSVTLVVSTVTNSTLYKMTISGVDFTYTSDSSATAAEIATGLATAYALSVVSGVTVTDNLDGTLTIASSVDWSIVAAAGLTLTAAAPVESWVDTLEAVQADNDTWYALTAETHVQADVEALAASIEAKKKIYGVSSSDLAIKTNVTTDLFSKLKAAGYQRTFGLWSATADTEFPECALVGYQLQERPGSDTWAHKTLAGATVSKLSGTESSNIKEKNGSTYEYVGGLNVTIGAKMFGGEWIDVMVFVDWLEARMRERIWFRLANSKKIPYTQAGATILETEVRAQLQEGVRVGGIADAPAFTVSVPDVTTLSPNMRAQRIFDGITFEARLAGAIHFVTVNGRVTV